MRTALVKALSSLISIATGASIGREGSITQMSATLASKLGLERGAVLGALSAWTQAGRAIWDLNKGVYRARELSREPLPMDKLSWMQDQMVELGQIPKAGDLAKMVNNDIRAQAVERAGK